MMRTIVITYTPTTGSYNPREEGFRFAHGPEDEGPQVTFTLDTDRSTTEILDAILMQTNPATQRPYVAGLAGQVFSAIPTAPPVQRGDSISVDGHLLSCETDGWGFPAVLLPDYLDDDDEY